jgi:hypothetical protein
MVLVSEPSFSGGAPAGMKKTSVETVFGSRPGSFHTEAVSVSNRSTTTSQSRVRSPLRDILALGLSTAGFWPITMNPLTFFFSISVWKCWCE